MALSLGVVVALGVGLFFLGVRRWEGSSAKGEEARVKQAGLRR